MGLRGPNVRAPRAICLTLRASDGIRNAVDDTRNAMKMALRSRSAKLRALRMGLGRRSVSHGKPSMAFRDRWDGIPKAILGAPRLAEEARSPIFLTSSPNDRARSGILLTLRATKRARNDEDACDRQRRGSDVSRERLSVTLHRDSRRSHTHMPDDAHACCSRYVATPFRLRGVRRVVRGASGAAVSGATACWSCSSDDRVSA